MHAHTRVVPVRRTAPPPRQRRASAPVPRQGVAAAGGTRRLDRRNRASLGAGTGVAAGRGGRGSRTLGRGRQDGCGRRPVHLPLVRPGCPSGTAAVPRRGGRRAAGVAARGRTAGRRPAARGERRARPGTVDAGGQERRGGRARPPRTAGPGPAPAPPDCGKRFPPCSPPPRNPPTSPDFRCAARCCSRSAWPSRTATARG